MSDETSESCIRLRLVPDWTTPKGLVECWTKMSMDGKGGWGNIRITDSEEDSDYDVIINKPPNGFQYNKDRTILIQMEPKMWERENMWGKWAHPEKLGLFLCLDHISFRNTLEWHLSVSYSFLKTHSPVKHYGTTISTILSANRWDPGHIYRLDFAALYDKKGKHPLHVYGRGTSSFGFKEHKGEIPVFHKEQGLTQYKYTFNAENTSYENYFTEKIVDAILCECLIFYWGCTNIEKYIDPLAFVRLPLDISLEASMEIMNSAIDKDLYSSRLPHIKKAKQKILEDLQFFPTMDRILREKLSVNYEKAWYPS